MSTNIESEEDSDQEIETIEPAKKQKISYATIARKFEKSEGTDESDDEDDFKRQLRLEKEEEERRLKKKTRIDPDGTEYEYDEQVKGWFPKVFLSLYALHHSSFNKRLKKIIFNRFQMRNSFNIKQLIQLIRLNQL